MRARTVNVQMIFFFTNLYLFLFILRNEEITSYGCLLLILATTLSCPCICFTPYFYSWMRKSESCIFNEKTLSLKQFRITDTKLTVDNNEAAADKDMDRFFLTHVRWKDLQLDKCCLHVVFFIIYLLVQYNNHICPQIYVAIFFFFDKYFMNK